MSSNNETKNFKWIFLTILESHDSEYWNKVLRFSVESCSQRVRLFIGTLMEEIKSVVM